MLTDNDLGFPVQLFQVPQSCKTPSQIPQQVSESLMKTQHLLVMFCFVLFLLLVYTTEISMLLIIKHDFIMRKGQMILTAQPVTLTNWHM